MTMQTNLVALDKTISAIRRAPTSYAAAAARCGAIAERVTRAIKCVSENIDNVMSCPT